MLYGDKLKECLKIEENPINKMYLNELILNWKKVENAVEKQNDSPITTIVSAVSDYTKHLSNPKFLYNDERNCGFTPDHTVFQSFYLYDIAEVLLYEAGIRDTHEGLIIRNRHFHTGFRLENDIYEVHSQKPNFEFFTSETYLNAGLEFDFHYRLMAKKFFNKTKLYIPLIVFYIEKHYTVKSFEKIEQLKKDMVVLNPNAMLICLTESVDKSLINYYTPIQDYLYVLRCNFKGDPFNPLQPQLFLSLYNKLHNYATKEMPSYERFVPFGHIDLVDKTINNIDSEEE